MDDREQLIAKRLMEKDPEFKQLMEEHLEFEKQLEDLNARTHLTPSEEMERKRIQKLKLAGKDKMASIMAKHRD